jgi:hypothetical protein
MKKRPRAGVLLAGLAISLTCVHASAAQKPKSVPPAPIPPQILSAKKVFHR